MEAAVLRTIATVPTSVHAPLDKAHLHERSFHAAMLLGWGGSQRDETLDLLHESYISIETSIPNLNHKDMVGHKGAGSNAGRRVQKRQF